MQQQLQITSHQHTTIYVYTVRLMDPVRYRETWIAVINKPFLKPQDPQVVKGSHDNTSSFGA